MKQLHWETIPVRLTSASILSRKEILSRWRKRNYQGVRMYFHICICNKSFFLSYNFVKLLIILLEKKSSVLFLPLSKSYFATSLLCWLMVLFSTCALGKLANMYKSNLTSSWMSIGICRLAISCHMFLRNVNASGMSVKFCLIFWGLRGGGWSKIKINLSPCLKNCEFHVGPESIVLQLFDRDLVENCPRRI